MIPTPETHIEYAKRVGFPRAVRCDIQLGPWHGYVWHCASHDYGYNSRSAALDGWLDDRCPMSRLEEWRARMWEAIA